jgi:hypothetical protein
LIIAGDVVTGDKLIASVIEWDENPGKVVIASVIENAIIYPW